MRREQKFITNGALIVGGIIVATDIILQFRELKKQGLRITLENYNYLRTIKRTLFGFMGGGLTGYLLYRSIINEERRLPFNSEVFLRKVISNENINKNPRLLKSVLKHREELKNWLAKHFNQELAGPPEVSGSFYKRTAISSNYDLDIILPFKRSSYPSLQAMYDSVTNAVKSKYDSIARVSERTKAISIEFENCGNPIYVDIVPGREICNYFKEKRLNLYMNPDCFWQQGRSFKIDVEKQKSIVVNKPNARQAIKLLKAYRDRNSLPLPTVIIEQSVVNALSENQFGVTFSLRENLINCMAYISEKLDQGHLIDISNSNNNLIDGISIMDRESISTLLKSDIVKVEENSRFIKEIFEL